MENIKALQKKLGAVLLPPQKREKIVYEVAYMENPSDDVSYCLASTKQRALRIAKEMSEKGFYFVEVAKYRGDEFLEVVLP